MSQSDQSNFWRSRDHNDPQEQDPRQPQPSNNAQQQIQQNHQHHQNHQNHHRKQNMIYREKDSRNNQSTQQANHLSQQLQQQPLPHQKPNAGKNQQRSEPIRPPVANVNVSNPISGSHLSYYNMNNNSNSNNIWNNNKNNNSDSFDNNFSANEYNNSPHRNTNGGSYNNTLLSSSNSAYPNNYNPMNFNNSRDSEDGRSSSTASTSTTRNSPLRHNTNGSYNNTVLSPYAMNNNSMNSNDKYTTRNMNANFYNNSPSSSFVSSSSTSEPSEGSGSAMDLTLLRDFLDPSDDDFGNSTLVPLQQQGLNANAPLFKPSNISPMSLPYGNNSNEARPSPRGINQKPQKVGEKRFKAFGIDPTEKYDREREHYAKRKTARYVHPIPNWFENAATLLFTGITRCNKSQCHDLQGWIRNCKKIDDFYPIFQELSTLFFPAIVLVNLISGLAKLNIEAALIIFRYAWERDRILVDPLFLVNKFVFSAIMDALYKVRQQRASSFVSEITKIFSLAQEKEKYSGEDYVFLYVIMMKSVAYDEKWFYFNQTIEKKIVNPHCFSTMIKCLEKVRPRDNEKLYLLMNDVLNNSPCANEHVYACLIGVCRDYRDAEGIERVYAEAVLRGKDNDVVFSNMLQALLELGDYKKFHSFYERARSTNNIWIYNIVLKGLAVYDYAELKNLYFYICELRWNDNVTDNTMLDAAVKHKDYVYAQKVYDSCKVRDVATFTSMVECAAVAKDFAKFEDVLAQARRETRLDSQLIAVAMDGYKLFGRYDNVRDLFEEAKNCRLANQFVYNAMLDCLVWQGKPAFDELLVLFSTMCTIDNGLVSSVTYGTVFNGAIRAGRFPEIEARYRSEYQKFLKDAKIICVLLKGYNADENYAEMDRLFKLAKDNGLADTSVYRHMLNSAVRSPAQYDKMRALYSEIPSQKAVVTVTMMKGAIKAKKKSDFLQLYESYTHEELRMNPLFYPIAIEGFGHIGDLDKMRALFNESLLYDHANEELARIYWAILNVLSSHKLYLEMQQYYLQLEIKKRNEYIYTIMFKAASAIDYPAKLGLSFIDFFNESLSTGKCNDVTFIDAMKCCTSKGKLPLAQQVFDLVRKRDKLNLRMYSLYVTCLGKIEEFKLAEIIFREAKDSSLYTGIELVEQRKVLYASILGVLRYFPVKMIAIFDEARKEGIEDNPVIFNTMIFAASHFDYGWMKRLFSEAEERGLADSVTYGTMMAGANIHGDEETMASLLERTPASSYLYSIMINRGGRVGDIREMKRLYAKARDNGLLSIEVIVSMARKEDLDGLVALLDEAERNFGEKCGPEFSNLLLQRFASYPNRFEEMKNLFLRLSKGSIAKIDPKSYNIYLKAACKAASLEEIIQLFDEIKRLDYEDSYTYAAVMKFYSLNGSDERVQSLMQEAVFRVDKKCTSSHLVDIYRIHFKRAKDFFSHSDFRIKRCIGDGAFGRVYLAEQLMRVGDCIGVVGEFAIKQTNCCENVILGSLHGYSEENERDSYILQQLIPKPIVYYCNIQPERRAENILYLVDEGSTQYCVFQCQKGGVSEPEQLADLLTSQELTAVQSSQSGIPLDREMAATLEAATKKLLRQCSYSFYYPMNYFVAESGSIWNVYIPSESSDHGYDAEPLINVLKQMYHVICLPVTDDAKDARTETISVSDDVDEILARNDFVPKEEMSIKDVARSEGFGRIILTIVGEIVSASYRDWNGTNYENMCVILPNEMLESLKQNGMNDAISEYVIQSTTWFKDLKYHKKLSPEQTERIENSLMQFYAQKHRRLFGNFVKEAQVMRALCDNTAESYLVSYFGVCVSPFWIIMEYVSGGMSFKVYLFNAFFL
jgi:hypothetical protein